MLQKLWKILFPSYAPVKGKTVRYAFPLVVLATIFAGLASVVTQDTSFITIETSPSTVAEGDLFYIEVKATAHTAVNAVDIVLSYPQDKISIDDIETGTSVITLWTEEPYAKDGKIYLRGGTFKRGFIGEHTIARVHAKALTSGIAHVTTSDVTFVAGDGKGTEVDVSDAVSEDSSVSITATDGALIATAEVTIVTDLDGNGSVDLRDVSAFMAAWFTKSKTFDFNGDGKMTFKDFSILLADSFFK